VRISVVADVHGNYDALARVAEAADRLIVLGDLLDYVDYHDPDNGMLAEIFGADATRRFAQLRFAGAFDELRRLNVGLWERLDDPVGVLAELVEARYRRVLQVVPPDTLVTLGNVDVVQAWNRVAGDTMPHLDGQAVEIDGVRIGFVGGGVSRRARPAGPTDRRAWRPYVRSPEEFRSAVDALGPVDVLCTHIPPDVIGLRYDVVPARLEMAGPGLIEYIDGHRPALALSGHVHQPLAYRVRRGWTECINVGHFQRAEEPFVIDLNRLPGARPAGMVAARPAGR
jgi:Icc-related predicted phosphoesterase